MNHPILQDDPQRPHLNDFHERDWPLDDDNGGVHLRSCIPNHAFYLFARKLGGRAWEKAGLIWFEVLVSNHSRIPTNASFYDMADRTIRAAGSQRGMSTFPRRPPTRRPSSFPFAKARKRPHKTIRSQISYPFIRESIKSTRGAVKIQCLRSLSQSYGALPSATRPGIRSLRPCIRRIFSCLRIS